MSATKTATDTRGSPALPRGVWPVMLTPFHAGKRIDWAGVDRLTDWYLEADVAGLFTVCLSSEMYELTDGERVSLARRVVERVHGRVPVVASATFADSPAAQTELVKRMADVGVEAVVCLVCQLAREREPDEQWRANAETLLDRTGSVPLGLYECPVPYHRLLTPESMAWAAATNRFFFLKETSCRLDLITAKLEAVRGSAFCFYNANTFTLPASLRLGVDGFSGIAANFYPRLWVWLCDHFEDDAETAEALHRFLTMAEALVSHKYPQSAKQFLAQAGLDLEPVCRRCDYSFDAEERRKLDVLREEAEIWQEKLGLPRHV